MFLYPVFPPCHIVAAVWKRLQLVRWGGFVLYLTRAQKRSIRSQSSIISWEKSLKSCLQQSQHTMHTRLSFTKGDNNYIMTTTMLIMMMMTRRKRAELLEQETNVAVFLHENEAGCAMQIVHDHVKRLSTVDRWVSAAWVWAVEMLSNWIVMLENQSNTMDVHPLVPFTKYNNSFILTSLHSIFEDGRNFFAFLISNRHSCRMKYRHSMNGW